MSARFSVIIPAYNAEQTIERAVESVLRQTYPVHQILVIDDGSVTPLSPGWFAHAPQVRVIRKRNGGAASARNLGLDKSTGEYIAFLDADDYWEPHKLAAHASRYQQSPGLGLTHSRYYEQTPAGERSLIGHTPPVATERELQLQGAQAFAWATAVWTGTVVVPRRLVADQRFVPGFEPAEDRDMWVRLLLQAPCCCLDAPLATAVLEANSLSRSNVDRDCANMLRVIKRHRQLLGMLAYCRWRSHTHYRWAACTDRPASAAAHVLRSALLWPWPYRRASVRMPLARLRLAVRLLRQLTLGAAQLGAHSPAGQSALTASEVLP